MAITLGEDKVTRDWGTIASAATEAVAQALTLGKDGFSSAISAFFRAIEAARGTETVTGRLEHWIVETAHYAFGRIVAAKLTEIEPSNEQIEHMITRLGIEINRAINDEKHVVSQEHLASPANLKIFLELSDFVVSEIEFLKLVHEPQAINHLFLDNVSQGWSRIRARRPEYFEPVVSALSGPAMVADTRFRAWEKYNAILISRFEDQILFGQELSTKVTIAQIYQRLRGYWIDSFPESSPELAVIKSKAKESSHPLKIEINFLDDMLYEWLMSNGQDGRVRLISGGPGSGKSTFARAFAAKMATFLAWRVLFVPLQRLRGSGDLGSRINDYFRLQLDDPFTDETLPLSMMGRDHYTNWLIIFDGLDEIAKEGSGSESAAQDFASALADWRARVGLSVNLNCVVLGRVPAMQQAQKRLNLVGRGTIYIADMLPMRLRQFSSVYAEQYEVVDKEKIRDLDQRSEFWRKWAVASRSGTEVPASMLSNDFADLTKEPLLAYLLILSGYATHNSHIAAQNRNYIYLSIFQGIWDRESAKIARIKLKELGKEGFDTLMQALGLAAWLGGGRTGDENNFNYMRDIYVRPNILKVAESCGAANLSNVALLFYTQRDEREGRGYEFLHKSFGEYLTARALFDAFSRWSAQMSNPDAYFEEKDFFEKWIRIAGQNHITAEILTFLRNEVAIASSKSEEPSWEVARNWVELAGRLVSYLSVKGHACINTGQTWRDAERFHNNAELNLFAVLDACARIAYPTALFSESAECGGWAAGPVRVSAFCNGDSRFTEAYIRMAEAFPNHTVTAKQGYIAQFPFVNQLLSRLRIQNGRIGGYSLHLVDFEGSHLESISLSGTSLTNANLSNCVFDDIISVKVDFTHTDSVNSHWERSHFYGVNFYEVDFSNTVFRSLTFDETKFKKAVFMNAKFLSNDQGVRIDKSTMDTLKELINLSEFTVQTDNHDLESLVICNFDSEI